jgi:hypothetical protein
MGCPFAREPRRGSRPWAFRQRPQALFDKTLARALDRDATGRDLLRNFLIAESFIGFQQNAGTRHLAGDGLARVDEPYKRLSLFCG